MFTTTREKALLWWSKLSTDEQYEYCLKQSCVDSLFVGRKLSPLTIEKIYKNCIKTLIIYNDIENPLRFLIVEGDYSRFNGVLINSTKTTGFENEFCEFFLEKETGKYKHILSEDVSLLEDKEWDKVAICTFLP